MKSLLFMSLTVLFAVQTGWSESKDTVYGKMSGIKDPTSISLLNAQPTKYKGQTVLVGGTVISVCQGSGCWVEVQSADSSRVICKSLDESVLFPKDVVGKTIQVQGKVLHDAKAPGTKMEKHKGGQAHACPVPQVMLSIDGATVTEVVEATPASEAEPKKE